MLVDGAADGVELRRALLDIVDAFEASGSTLSASPDVVALRAAGCSAASLADLFLEGQFTAAEDVAARESGRFFDAGHFDAACRWAEAYTCMRSAARRLAAA